MEETLRSHIKCSICLGILHNAASTTPCLHSFCMGCILLWKNKNCPLCREMIGDIVPNFMLRDIVNNYLTMKPELKKHKEEVEELDKLELEYNIRWLAETDEYILSIENSGVFPQKFQNMMNRAYDLLAKLLNDNSIAKDEVKKTVDKIVENLQKEVYARSLQNKYRDVELTYRKMVSYSVAKLGISMPTWLGRYYYENRRHHDEINEFPSMFLRESNVSGRIDQAISQLKNRNVLLRTPTRNQGIRDHEQLLIIWETPPPPPTRSIAPQTPIPISPMIRPPVVTSENVPPPRSLLDSSIENQVRSPAQLVRITRVEVARDDPVSSSPIRRRRPDRHDEYQSITVIRNRVQQQPVEVEHPRRSARIAARNRGF